MKFKSFGLTILLLFFAVLSTACQTSLAAITGGEQAVEEEQQAAAVVELPVDDGGPIVIGTSLPLSERRAEAGLAVKRGYEVWAAMVNEAGGLLGRPVELKILDNASDQEKAAADYEKLITEDKVDLVMGTQSSFLVIPSSEVVARYGYAYVEPAGGAPDVFNRGLNNIFFAQPARAARQADPFALYLLGLPEDQRPKTFALVTSDDDFALSVMENLKALLLRAELDLVFETTYPQAQEDFSEIAAQVAALDPDMIVGGTQFEDTILQIQAYQAANYQPRIAYFTSGPSVSGAFLEELGPATEGVFSSVSWFPEAPGYQNEEFVNKYIEMFGGSLADIAEDAANGFTTAQVLQQAVEKIQSIDNAALINELHQGRYETVVGPLSFDEVGAPRGSFMLLQWQGGKFVIVGPSDRASAEAVVPKPEW